MTRLGLAIVGVVAACGSSPSAGGADGYIRDDSATVAANRVELAVTTAPSSTLALVAYRDGSNAWENPVASALGTYELFVTNDYVVVVACTGSNGGTATFDAEELASTFAEGTQPTIVCDAGADTSAYLAVTGTMAQPGAVWMTDHAASSTASWTYTLHVPSGYHDLVASDDTHVVLRRGQLVNAAFLEPALDVDADGVALVAVPFTVTGLSASGSPTTETSLVTLHDFATVAATTSTTAHVIPASALVGGDIQDVEIDEFADGGTQFARVPYPGEETSVDLLPPISNVALDTSNGIAASWSSPTRIPYTAVVFDLQTTGDTPSFVNVEASLGWTDVNPAAPLAFDTSPPGFLPAWEIAPTTRYQYYLELEDVAGDTLYGTSAANDGPTAAAMRRAHAARARLRSRRGR